MTPHIIDALSLACAGLGARCMIVWPVFPHRRHMLMAQLGIALGFGAHYWLEGAQTAAILNGLGALHVLASLTWGTNRRLKWLGYAMIPAVVLACLVTWSGLPSAFSGLGTTLIAIGRVQVTASRLRLFVLIGTPFWLVHDLMIGSPLFIADAISIAMGLFAMARDARPIQQQSSRRAASVAGMVHQYRGRIDPFPSESINRKRHNAPKPFAATKSQKQEHFNELQ